MKKYTSSGYQDKEKGITSHYGILIDNNKPITGVMNLTDAEFLYEDILKGIDSYFEEHLKECKNEYHDNCYFSDNCEGYLIGFILDKKTGLYDIDSDAEYSMIIGEIYGQIVYSKYVSKAALCSPCYSGQGDLGTAGEYLTYTLPIDVWGVREHLKIIDYNEVKT